MSGHADAGPSVSVARAIDSATARLATYDAAIEVLGVSPAEALMRDARRTWEGARDALVAIQSDARYITAADPDIMLGLRVQWAQMATDADAGHAGHLIGGAEVFAMLAVEWGDIANEHVQRAQRAGLRP